jgi:hypothetical protein
MPTRRPQGKVNTMSEQIWTTCGTCGRSWDYPTPAGRCPHEYDHEEPEPEPDIPEWYWVDGGDAFWLFGDVLLCCPIAADGTIL